MTDTEEPKPIRSEALEANLARSRISVCIERKYEVLLDVMEKYPGVLSGLEALLEEVCHP